jgi:hypothetical protein
MFGRAGSVVVRRHEAAPLVGEALTVQLARIARFTCRAPIPEASEAFFASLAASTALARTAFAARQGERQQEPQ